MAGCVFKACSAVISLSSPITFDYESGKDKYTLNIRASGGGIDVDREFVLSITDANDAPEFASGAIIRPLAENDGTTETTSTGTSVGDPVVANDEDGDNISYALDPVVAEFEIDASGQIKVKTATNFNHEVKGSYTVTVKATDDATSPASSTKEVVISITDANDTPVFVGGASVSRSLRENQGKLSTDVDTVVGAPVVANDADKPEETISFVLDPVSTEFKIDASGQIKVKTATNFNHEKTAAYTVTVKATDDGTPAASANQEMVINIADQPETPGNYSNHSLVTLGATGSQITLSWNNTEYEAQFDVEDLYSIVISYGTGGSGVGTLTLAADATEATLAGLNSGTSYAITLQWLSRDGLGSNTPATVAGTTTAAGIEIDKTDLSALTPDSKTSAISLRLGVAPASANVTLTITSVNPEHVEVDKQTMVFSTSTWNTWQALMFSLTDAGAGIEGVRSVAVSITVHDQGNSDTGYRSVAGQEVAVKVDVPYAGKAIYEDALGCASSGCHGQDGMGSSQALDPLSDNIENDKEKAIRTILGLEGGTMGAFGFAARMSNADIADVLTYIYNSWSNSGGPVTEAQVKQVRDTNAFDATSLAASRAEGDAAEGDVLATVELSANEVGESVEHSGLQHSARSGRGRLRYRRQQRRDYRQHCQAVRLRKRQGQVHPQYPGKQRRCGC